MSFLPGSSRRHDCLGSGDSSVVRAPDSWSKGRGSSPGRSGERIFFPGVNFLCWVLFRYPFHPRLTAVARKWSWWFCQKCRWRVTAKHTCILRMWLPVKRHCKLVYSCIVHTERAPRRKQLHVTPALCGVVLERPRSVVTAKWVVSCTRITCIQPLSRFSLTFLASFFFSESVCFFLFSFLFHHTLFLFDLWLIGQFVPAVSLPD